MRSVHVEMELSSTERVDAVAVALKALPSTRVLRRLSLGPTRIVIMITTEDPDLVEIAQELTWQYDPRAVQLSLMVLEGDDASASDATDEVVDDHVAAS